MAELKRIFRESDCTCPECRNHKQVTGVEIALIVALIVIFPVFIVLHFR